MPLQTADRLAQQHQRDLATIAGGTASAVFSLALGADPAAISTWYFSAVDGILARIQAGNAQARRSSTEFLRRHAGMNGVDLTPVPSSLDMTRARTSMRVTGPVAFKTAIGAGLDQDLAVRSMAVQMSGASDRLVRAGDRDTFRATLDAKTGIIGYRRRLSGRACGFCAMLASRGAVYVSKATAQFAADGQRYHDHCRCWPEPLYDLEDEPADVRELQRQWQRVTAGKSGDAAQIAWREHWENRATPAARQRMGLAASEPRPSLPGVGVRTPGMQIRPELEAARTTGAVERAFQAEFTRITGRKPPFTTFAGSAATAREHAEGLLRGLERYPDAKLRGITVTGFGSDASSYAHVLRGDIVAFNPNWTGPAARRRYLDSLASDVAGWEHGVQEFGVGLFKASAFHPRGTGNPISIALHEFGHVVDDSAYGAAVRSEVDQLLLARTRSAMRRVRPVPETPITGADDLIMREISGYANKNQGELIAEAFADVMTNGDRASSLSKEIVAILDRHYEAAGGRLVRTAASLPGGGVGAGVPEIPAIRPLLAQAKSTAEVERILTAEMERLTGQWPVVVLTGMSSATAREVAEGVLRGVERFPATDVRQVLMLDFSATHPTAYALHDSALGSLEFNELRASLAGRQASVEMLAKDVAGDIPFHVRGSGSWTGISVHEFGHALDIGTVGKNVRPEVNALLIRRAAARDAELAARRAAGDLIDSKDFLAGGGVDGLIRREISEYATRNGDELIAEAFADVLMNGPDASPLSREIFDLLEAEYRRGGRRVGTPGITSASESAPNLSKLTVPQLRALAKERSVAVPAAARKADIVAALEGPAKPAVKAVAPDLSKLKVADLRALAADQKITLPPRATKAQIVEALQQTPDQRRAAAQRAVRDAARERNRLIEQATGTEKLLAHLDEILAKGADAKVVRQALDEKLITPEQLFGNADPAVLASLRTAFADGDVAKLRAAITRQSTARKLKVVGGKAGTKVTFDPDLMESVGGAEIRAGTRVQVVTRGASVTLPDGSTLVLTKAKVALVPTKEKPLLGKPITKRELEIANAKREIPVLERKLRTLSASDPQRASVQYRLDNARAIVDQKPGSAQYNWASPLWDVPAASKVLRPPTRAELQAHIDLGVLPVPKKLRTEASQELMRQAEVTPRSMLEFKGLADSATFRHATSPDAYAYYDYNFKRVTFHPRWETDEAAIRSSYASDISVGWHPPTSRSVFDSTLAHEYGHHLANRMLRESPTAAQRKMIQLIDDQLGMGGQLVRDFRKNPDLGQVIDDFVKGPYAVGRVDRTVSRYARKSAQEFFAEIWSEYTTSDNPRRQVKAIGDMMRDMAEASDVVIS